jgi:hypothetical protein
MSINLNWVHKLFLFILITILFSCQKEGNEKFNSGLDVHEFVRMVKNGEYDSWCLPNFSPQDIPLLLEYANDFQEVPYFPHNLLSSYLPPRLTLGECMMWTIEFIKNNYGKDNFTLPSNHAVLCEDGFEFDRGKGLLIEQELLEVYCLFLNWWNSNQGNDFSDFRDTEVLYRSGYHWI